MSIVENGRHTTYVEVGRRQEMAQAIVLRRAAFLLPKDRALIELALKGTSRSRIGALLGIPAGTVSRRVRRIAARLYDPIVIALLENPGELRPEYRQLGVEFFLQKRTAQELADLHNLSRGQVQRMIVFLRGWFRGRSDRR